MDEMELLAIKAAQGNNGGTWADHYTDDHKAFWRSFVRELAAAEREACARIAETAPLRTMQASGDTIAAAIRARLIPSK